MLIGGAALEGPIHFYNGEITLWFDRAKWKYYRLEKNGKYTPIGGVTTPVHIIDKSDVLTPWAAKMVVQKAIRLFEDARKAESERGSLLNFEYEEILRNAQTAPRDKLEEAGNVGTQAHQKIEALILYAITFTKGIVEFKGFGDEKDHDPRVVSCVKAALDWMSEHKVKWLQTERKVYSRLYDYAGTMDGLCLVDGKVSVADWKTSNGLYPEYCYQTAAYQHAYQEETGETIADRWILRLGKEDAEFDPWHLPGQGLFDQDFKIFRLCQDLSAQHKVVKARMAPKKRKKSSEEK